VSRSDRLNRIILISFFFITGCSYSPSVTTVSEANLSNYNPTHFTKPRAEERISNENDLIIQAIWHEMNGDFVKSNYFYNILYQKTKKTEYMFRELTTALYINKTSENVENLEIWSREHPSDIQAKRLLISFYINEKENEKAKMVGSDLLSKSGDAIDFELSASPYILSGEYKKSVELLIQAYNKNYNEDILIKITTLLVNYLGDVDTAIMHLENYRTEQQCSEKICGQLLEIYTKLERVPELMSIYHELYTKTKKDVYAVKIVDGYVYTQDFDKAIEFLQNDYQNDELLYELYLAKKEYTKALEVAKKLYVIQQKPKWLAESAMALYESATNKDDAVMLKSVVSQFEDAVKLGVTDSVYLNYYGYTLIDKDIDVEKGVDIVKDALKEQPNNSYYLDSLAWGYYKLNLCKEAFVEMKKVVDIEGLKEEEIIEHWTSIQECNK
jgi:lipopolysaccharide biosynthesis regulator YciM